MNKGNPIQKSATILLLALTLGLVPALGEVTTSSVPAVVEQLQEIYGVVEPTHQVGLPELVDLQRRYWPQAWVTSTFYDWRTVSKYRRREGLHLGYDIALPATSPVAVGWPGQVSHITHWYGDEFGVTVTSADGTSVTYGHLRPRVRVGERLATGDIVGEVVVDHVDVKMQDARGRYVPFGEGDKLRPGLGSGSDREAVFVTWLVARNSLESVEEQLWRFKALGDRRRLEREQLERRLPKLREAVRLMEEYQQRGLVSRRKAEQTRQELADAEKSLERVEEGSQSLFVLKAQRLSAERRLQAIEGVARRAGYRWSDVEAFVNSCVASDRSLEKAVQNYKRVEGGTQKDQLTRLEKQVAEGRVRLKTLEGLYEMGGLSLRDLEAARERQRLLELELEGRRKASRP